MILSHIVATSNNWVIGDKGKLPWHIPKDLKFFKQKTINHIIIMGRKTFFSLPNPLSQRLHIVITKNKDQYLNFIKKNNNSNIIFVNNINESIEIAKKNTKFNNNNNNNNNNEVFIIGGGEIFKQSIDIIDYIYLTKIHQSFPGDIFYPNIDENQFKIINKKDFLEEKIPFSFILYKKN